ncbi:BatD family protein [Methanosarcina hadiensis]|uniref:BatD family protein n=1 Tax=Methanosarcina hadiensis TaxID=3078083 RepID=UPI003977936C
MAKKILLIGLLTVCVFSILSMTAAAEDVEWVEKQDGAKLYWGQSVTVDGYEIKAEDFNEDKMVFVSISKDGEKLKTSPLTAGLEFEYNDEIKVYAQKVDPNYEVIKKDEKEFKTGNWNPYAELDILIRGKPGFDIDVETKKDTYDSKTTGDSRIDVSIKVKNDGDAKAKNVVLTVNTAGLEVLSGKTKHTYTNVLKDATLEPINLTLKTSTPWEDTDLNITATTICEDAKGKKYEHVGFKEITIEKKWDLIVSKRFIKERHMGETVPVSVTVRNAGLCDINNIVLKDSVVSNMHLQNDAALEKTLSLKPGETSEDIFKYTLVPERPGEYTFPKTVATFTLSNGQSEQVESDNSEKITIYGPYIEITKTVDKQQLNPGDKLTVTVTAKNTGNVDASVTVTDTVPSETKLISGETSFKQVLDSNGGSKTITYIMQMNKEGEVKIPACKASFLDLDKYSGEVYSEASTVNVGAITLEGSSSQPAGSTDSNVEKEESSGQSTDSEEGYGDTPGFGFFLAVAGLFACAGFIRKKSSKK